jgi:ketosteroid isomerase-like protein
MKKDEIIKLEEDLRQAMLVSDVDKLNVLIADSLIFTAYTGIVIDKQTDLNTHRSGLLRLTRLEPSEQRVELYGNFAIVTVKMSIESTFDNRPSAGNFRFTRVWQNHRDIGK